MQAFRLAYDGQPYHGFQRQPDVATVEDDLFGALAALDILPTPEGSGLDAPPEYAAAGRTDAGVSALAQTVAFAAPDWLSPAALNSELPAAIRAWASAPAPESFHATHDARSRTYTYYLHSHAGTAPLGEDRLHEAIDALRGKHDFHNLTPDTTGTVRDLSITIEREGPLFVLTFEAGGFARQLVRRLVALIALVGRGEATMDRIDRVLSSTPLSGPDGIGPAPAFPLVLTDVSYPALSFDRDEDAARTATQLFERQRIEHATRARVAGRIASGIEE